jgi:aminoglycoside/choline kinase family phosphotransferase
MDNGAPDGNGFPQFEMLSRHLSGLGLVVPEILHVDTRRRFVVLTDLGTDTLAKRIRTAPSEEPALFSSVIDILPLIGKGPPPPDLAVLTPDVGAEMIAPLFEAAAPGAPTSLRDEIASRVGEALADHCDAPNTLSLRDFHAENIIWRPEASGVGTFGLLDFQDAFIAAPEYDLASLIRDVRRDVSSQAADRSRTRFAENSGKSLESVSRACATLALQRNLRILGIFAKLAGKKGKTRYLDFLPRTIRLIREDADHPALASLVGPVERVLGHLSV